MEIPFVRLSFISWAKCFCLRTCGLADWLSKPKNPGGIFFIVVLSPGDEGEPFVKTVCKPNKTNSAVRGGALIISNTPVLVSVSRAPDASACGCSRLPQLIRISAVFPENHLHYTSPSVNFSISNAIKKNKQAEYEAQLK